MIIELTTSSIGLRGTRVDVDLKPSGKSNISLATDSFGNVGAIEVNLDGQTSNITSTEQVLEISENNKTTSRDKTDNEKEEAKIVGETLIKSSKIDEEEITKQLQQKCVFSCESAYKRLVPMFSPFGERQKQHSRPTPWPPPSRPMPASRLAPARLPHCPSRHAACRHRPLLDQPPPPPPTAGGSRRPALVP